MDVLRNQIVERKVIELILAQRHVQGSALRAPTASDEAALDHAAGGGEHREIPEAKYDDRGRQRARRPRERRATQRAGQAEIVVASMVGQASTRRHQSNGCWLSLHAPDP